MSNMLLLFGFLSFLNFYVSYLNLFVYNNWFLMLSSCFDGFFFSLFSFSDSFSSMFFSFFILSLNILSLFFYVRDNLVSNIFFNSKFVFSLFCISIGCNNFHFSFSNISFLDNSFMLT